MLRDVKTEIWRPYCYVQIASLFCFAILACNNSQEKQAKITYTYKSLIKDDQSLSEYLGAVDTLANIIQDSDYVEGIGIVNVSNQMNDTVCFFVDKEIPDLLLLSSVKSKTSREDVLSSWSIQTLYNVSDKMVCLKPYKEREFLMSIYSSYSSNDSIVFRFPYKTNERDQINYSDWALDSFDPK